MDYSHNKLFINTTSSDGTNMELEELNPSAPIGLQQDVESVEWWAEHNGISYGTARVWAYRGVLLSVKLGRLCMVNSALLRNWLLEQEWTAWAAPIRNSSSIRFQSSASGLDRLLRPLYVS